MLQKKEQEKASEKEPSKTETRNIPNKEFKVMIVKTLTGLKKGMRELSETFNKEIENIEKNQSGLKNTVTEVKNTLERITNRLEDVEEQISNLKDRVMETTQAEQ